ncbi:hypothetical protein EUU23_10520 [Sphingorhabdus sp. IMCC26285]|uniref:Uncharacterized protein n=1 Tax=Sphingorhabdus profundilacus TaxID=2509718 RepID=A0A6I4M1N8_9SPHN|nr:hypothetical protein [Sphingorhabdus profundilacus]MVZ98126.1 hypothetical protein [Sphingorhabdus profundilacus]
MEWIGAGLSYLKVMERKADFRWQDKSTAVGWGAGYWNYTKNCASPLPAVLAADRENGSILAFSAPSRRHIRQFL